MKRVLLLGSTGMLGRAVLNSLMKEESITTITLDRSSEPGFDARNASSVRQALEARMSTGAGFDFVVNTIGLTKVGITRAATSGENQAHSVNVEFPRLLAEVCAEADAHILTIGTDCVFSGREGPYFEDSLADANDVYGVSKRLGEANLPKATIVRSSFVGLQPKEAPPMLLEWLIRQPKGASIHGFTNHLWNGTTSVVLGRMLASMIRYGYFPIGTFHLVPNYEYSKLELLRVIARYFHRGDLRIDAVAASESIDRRLATRFPEVNENLWRLAGQSTPEKIDSSILELSERS